VVQTEAAQHNAWQTNYEPDGGREVCALE